MAINTPGQKETKAYITSETLKQIRNNTDWKRLFEFLGLKRDEKKSKPDDWWAISPFNEDEKTPSFHLNDNGFFCFSTRESGGVIELVQKFFLYQYGEHINCYEAGIWLVENNLSTMFSSEVPLLANRTIRSEKKKRKGMIVNVISPRERENQPIRQDLTPLLTLQGEHEQFIKRGISKKTCQYLGCGYLEKSRSPLQERIVFQIRGVIKGQKGNLQPVILSHIGRATTQEQEEQNGKWSIYKGFQKSLELYNIDKLLTDQKAVHQAQESKRVYIVEGCFDTAKLIEAGIYNVVSTLGGHISESQLQRMQLIKDALGEDVEFFVWFDRDAAGKKGQEEGLKLLRSNGFKADAFNWNKKFLFPKRGKVSIPSKVKDVCDFDVKQLQWFKSRKIV